MNDFYYRNLKVYHKALQLVAEVYGTIDIRDHKNASRTKKEF